MLFNSIEFLLFFTIVTGGYFVLPHRFRWLWLLLASCLFYMFFVPIYILILGFTIVVDYFAGRLIEQSEGGRRRFFLVVSLIVNIGVLAFFKYFNFLNDTITVFLHGINWHNPIPSLKILLPIGLSFHTFQAMSYTIEVYRKKQSAERHLGIYALYVMFYPQLVAGPIERPQNLLPQFREKHIFDYERVTSGLKLMAWGLLKKVVIADRLAILVDRVYDHSDEFNGFSLMLATVCFAYQIYCDFSGYTDMAIGAAKVMGFKLMRNFDRPYSSKSIQEFWQRWHISLSTWLRDYLYIPLGGNRVSTVRHGFNLLLVFLLCGLWHGASWTFVVWGALHGFYRLVEIVTQKKRLKLCLWLDRNHLSFLSIATTFVLISFAWIFFRANSLHHAWSILEKMALTFLDLFQGQLPAFQNMGFSFSNVLLSIALIIGLEFIQKGFQTGFIHRVLQQKSAVLRWSLYYVLLLMIIFMGVFEHRQFIYFQF
jgi:alginate O-acetyltransferase complex protein AlgI